MLDPASFLQITLLKLGALFTFKMQSGIAQGSVHFDLHFIAVGVFTLAHYSSLFRAHLHPALGIPSKNLSIFSSHRDPSIARLVQSRSVARWGHSTGVLSLRPLRLR